VPVGPSNECNKSSSQRYREWISRIHASEERKYKSMEKRATDCD
jgi:hypothetical protein